MEILVIFVVYICKLLPYFDKNSAIFCFSEPVIDIFFMFIRIGDTLC